jgi:GntR family transcriptional regulator / MocR family aminotransferase
MFWETTVDLPVLVDRSAAEPLTAQLIRQLRAAMREGRLTAGERLPSSRALAATLGLSRTVVMDAYAQLYAEGWLDGRHGSGTYVAEIQATTPQPERRAAAAQPRPPAPAVIDLRPGVPWTGALDTPAWRRAWRLAASAAPVGRADPFGSGALRAALGEHMRRTRGIGCPPEQIIVTRGATNGLDMLAATVLRPGDRVGVEEPGYPTAREVLAARGARLVPCPVDEHGLIVDGLPDDLKLIYTTPSHQYPLGGVLPVPRRQALVAWARRTGALIAEDDYDGEFRYDVGPLPTLYAMDQQVVVHLGTMSKRLTADVGVGWLAADPALVAAIAGRRGALHDLTAVVPQEAVRILVERGDLDRHIRRMRAEYGCRRALVVEALRGHRLRGETAGLHLVLELPPDLVPRVVERAGREGVLLDALDRYHTGPPMVHGLVIGYGSAGRGELRNGCVAVARLLT